MVKQDSLPDTERFTNIEKSRLRKFKTVDKLLRSTGTILEEDILELVQTCIQLACLVYYGDAVAETKQPSFTGIVEKIVSLNEEEKKGCDCCLSRNIAWGEVHVCVSKELSNLEDRSFILKLLGKTFNRKLTTRQHGFVFLTCDSHFLNEVKKCLEKYEKLLEDVNRKYSKERQDKCLAVLLYKDNDDIAKVLVEPFKDVGLYLHSEPGSEDTFEVVSLFLGNYTKQIKAGLNVRIKVLGDPSFHAKEGENQELPETQPSTSGTNNWLSYCPDLQYIDPITLACEENDLDQNQPDDNGRIDLPSRWVSHESHDIDNMQPAEDAVELKDIFRNSLISPVDVLPDNSEVKIAQKPKDRIKIWCSFGISTFAALVGVVAIIFVSTQKEHVSYQGKDPTSSNHSHSIANDPEVLLLIVSKIKQIQAQNLPKTYTIKQTPVSAHKSLAIPPRIPGSENKPDPYFKKDYNVCVRINKDNSSRDHARGVNVDIDGLIILYSGLYFVYSSVTFKPNSTTYSSTFPYQTWFQYIYKLRPNSPAHSTVLTRVVHTCCLNCTNSQNTAYSGGVFYLLAGDKLQVCLTGQGLLAYDDTTTYLGLFMISGTS